MYYVTKSIYLGPRKVLGSNFLQGQDAHGGGYTAGSYTLATANTNTIWTVAKNASGSYSAMTASVTATVFTAAPKLTFTALPAIGDGWIFGPYNGVFPRNTMSFQLDYVSTTVSAQAGLITYRLWRASNVAGSVASLITPTYQKTNIIAGTAGGNRVSGSWAMTSSLSMQNEYLVLEVAWGITTASGANNSNYVFRAGSGSFFKTGPFEDNSFIMLSDDNIGNNG